MSAGGHTEPITLICLPFAGGTSTAFRDFSGHSDPRIRVLPVDLPGHGTRFGEPLLETLGEMTDFVFDEVRGCIAPDAYAIFGHSMGGMLAYLLARRIRDELLPPPLHVFISARRSSHTEPPFYWKDLSRDQFLDRLGALGGIPQEVLRSRELMEIFEPILYNDIKALETHEHNEIAPLLSPITVFLGTDDDIPVEDALHWCRETIGPLRVEVFPGGHFFAFERAGELAGRIGRTLLETAEINRRYREAAARML